MHEQELCLLLSRNNWLYHWVPLWACLHGLFNKEGQKMLTVQLKHNVAFTRELL